MQKPQINKHGNNCMIIEHEVLYNKQSCVSQMMPQAILHKELDMLFCLSVSKNQPPFSFMYCSQQIYKRHECTVYE